MTDRRDDNALGLGPRDREGSNTGSTADTSYDAAGSDPNPADDAHADLAGGSARPASTPPRRSRPADPDSPSSDEP